MITTITYRRVKNLGNYESEALQAEYLLLENETPEEGMIKLRSFVLHELYPEDPNKVTEDDIDNISF